MKNSTIKEMMVAHYVCWTHEVDVEFIYSQGTVETYEVTITKPYETIIGQLTVDWSVKSVTEN